MGSTLGSSTCSSSRDQRAAGSEVDVNGISHSQIAENHRCIAPHNQNSSNFRHTCATPSRGHYCISAIGGNAHNVFGLVEFEVPFDFVLPSREDLGADPVLDLVPVDLVAKLLEDRVRPALAMIDELHSIVGERILVLESPPPIGDNSHILKHSGPYFLRRYGRDWKIVSPAFRYKIWRVSSALYIDFCSRRSIEFLPAPAETMEDGMFLRPEGWPPNATHANRWYGEKVIRDAQRRLAEGVTWN